MDECCRIAHAKLISGTCPWCGQTVQNGQACDPASILKKLQQSPGRRPATEPSIKSLVLDQGPLEPKVAVQYAQLVAAQLNAHFSTAPHRNVSPANIFVSGTGAVIVGAPYALDEESSLVLDDTEEDILGSADCLAPEQPSTLVKRTCV